jgi:hypothetical protein
MATRLFRLSDAELADLDALLDTFIEHTEGTIPFNLSGIPAGVWNMVRVSDPGVFTVNPAAVAPSIRSVGTQASTASNTSMTVNLGTHQAGDVICVHAFARQNATINMTGDDYAQIGDDTPGSSSTYFKASRWWIRATTEVMSENGGVMPAPTINFGVGGPKIVRSFVVRGCKATDTPCYSLGTPSNFSNAAGTSLIMPGGPVLDAKSLVVPGFVTSQTAGLGSILSGNFSNDDLTGITELFTHAPGSADIAAYVRYGVCNTAKTIADTLATITSAFRRAAFCDVFIPA